MSLVVCVLPVLLFLAFLFLLDSFKLVVKRFLVYSLLWGICSAGIAYFFNSFLIDQVAIDFKTVSRFIAPFTEEFLKATLILTMVYKKRIGFMIDAAIYGFAIGAGFSLLENLLYLKAMADQSMIMWIIRGFGTAFMHGGCTAMFAVIYLGGKSRSVSIPVILFISILCVYLIHSGFNHFYTDPLFQTIGIVMLMPLIFIMIFRYNEIQLRKWLEIEFNSEVELLGMIKMGKFLSTKSGEFLESIKTRFSSLEIFDMYCYLSIYLELSIKAKRNLLLKESGFEVIIESEIQSKLAELKQLKKQIGKVGELTLTPLIRMNYRDLWKLNSLKENSI